MAAHVMCSLVCLLDVCVCLCPFYSYLLFMYPTLYDVLYTQTLLDRLEPIGVSDVDCDVVPAGGSRCTPAMHGLIEDSVEMFTKHRRCLLKVGRLLDWTLSSPPLSWFPLPLIFLPTFLFPSRTPPIDNHEDHTKDRAGSQGGPSVMVVRVLPPKNRSGQSRNIE